ncbi:hypothetical protein BN1088_150008 [Sphingobacterium sp. PM2-P1-29]|nr:hypothetical protein BN1088_150008 [Sphingobacterium sp. PM2-P1-29]
MVNRILKWWQDVMDWKERFEKLFPPSFLQSRSFKKAELKKLEKILAYPSKKLSEDERLSQKMLYQEQYKKLEKSLYPNPIVRLARNAGKLSFTALKWSFNKIFKQAPVGNKNQISNNTRKPTTDSEVREFLNKSLATTKKAVSSKQKVKVGTPAMNANKVTGNNQKKTGVVVPFKPSKSVQKGISR